MLDMLRAWQIVRQLLDAALELNTPCAETKRYKYLHSCRRGRKTEVQGLLILEGVFFTSNWS